MAKNDKLDLKKAVMNREENSELVAYVKEFFGIADSEIELLKSPLAKLVPQGSFFDELLKKFYKYTDIPLEIPFFSGIHYLSAYLIENEIQYEFAGKTYDCDLWTIALADSGAGKTTGSNMVKDAINFQNKVTSFPTTTARFLDDLSEGEGNRRLYEQDEFVKYLSNMRSQGYSKEMEEILLSIYSHKTIHRKVRKRKKKDEEEGINNTIAIENPCISILGFAPYQSFINNVSNEDIASGFFPRFSIVRAENDPERPFEPGRMFYRETLITENLNTYWQEMINSIQEKKYIFTDDMIDYFEKTFFSITTNNESISHSFVRRLFFLGFKYAVIYHIILGKGRMKEIDKQDIHYASIMFHYLLKQTGNIIIEADTSDLQKIVKQAKEVRKRMIEKKGKCIPSDLVNNIRGLKNANEAKSILFLIEEEINIDYIQKIKKEEAK